MQSLNDRYTFGLPQFLANLDIEVEVSRVLFRVFIDLTTYSFWQVSILFLLLYINVVLSI